MTARSPPLALRAAAAVAPAARASTKDGPCEEDEEASDSVAEFFLARGRRFADALQALREQMLSRAGARGGRGDSQADRQASRAAEEEGEVAEVTSLYLAALMNLRPWKIWQPETDLTRRAYQLFHSTQGSGGGSELQPGCRPFLSHPGLCHFHVHLMEGAPTKRLVLEAEPSAQSLRTRWVACGHLLHMASHIDVHLGRYAASVETNRRGIAADEAHAAFRGRETYYHTYRLHTYNQLVWSASLDGQYAAAARAAEDILATTPPSLLKRYEDFVEPVLADVWYVLVRFGRFAEILARPLPPLEAAAAAAGAPSAGSGGDCCGDGGSRGGDPPGTPGVQRTTALWAKAIAHASLGHVAEATAARDAFRAALAATPRSRFVHMVRSSETLAVASAFLDGELAYRLGRFDEAFSRLREAQALELALPYDEPWGWMTPVAHALGALLLERGRLEEAREVFAADLARWPHNPWSTLGLLRCAKAAASAAAAPVGSAQQLQQQREIDELEAQYKRAAERMDAPGCCGDGEVQPCFCAGLPIFDGSDSNS
mmetsp:Transcript_62630/g.197761  ORF Transcript_62630/g.197761 Transcript_62630/m.197761 type:complete len:544 (-) Transcript_62630:96-1727(-)